MIEEIRFIMINKDKIDNPGALIFPDELKKLKSGLQIFCQKLFEDNKYGETPLFRGLFFSSAVQSSDSIRAY